MLTQVRPVISPRPFLKWAGGKGQLISQYQAYFPKTFQTYYEPFLGGGAVFFFLQPRRSMLTDINAELVNVYCCVRDRVEEVIDRLEQHRIAHSAEYYYQVRSQREHSDGQFVGNNLARAARLIYLNKTCFNGLYRENSQGHFNVPLGRYKNPTICDAENLWAVSEALQGTRIQQQSFEAVLDHAQSPRDFVYFDPPYYPLSETSKFTGYSRHAFGTAEQIRLRQVFGELSDRGVQVMLSNSDCEFIRELYRDYPIHTIQASRNINSKATRRGKITEVLVTSYEVKAPALSIGRSQSVNRL